MKNYRLEVLKAWPDAYAAFLGSSKIECPAFLGGSRRSAIQGWIIRRYAHGDFTPMTFVRRQSESEAWTDAHSILQSAGVH